MTTSTSRRLGAALGGLTLACLFTACEFEPKARPTSHSLAPQTHEVLAEHPDVAGQVAGALEMLFGSPGEPRYMITAGWTRSDFDPNHPDFPADDGGSGDLDDAQWEAIVAGNERRFRSQLEAIRAGRFEDVPPVRGLSALDDAYREELAAREASDDEGEFAELAAAIYTDYYPSLRESAELYRQQCMHCHGVSGGGDGPTSPYLEPRPRDYRNGTFKWTAVGDKARPRRQDLYNVLDQGVYMTAMPSFRRFSSAELHGLVDYVKLLSKRGEVERLLRLTFEDGDPITPELVVQNYQTVFDRWAQANEKLIVFEGEVPASTPERIAQGQAIFMDAAKGNCFSCHGDRGLGDGVAAKELDPETGEMKWVLNEWGEPSIPRNLPQGIFRGGHRPIDIYRRIYAGINGTPMPATAGVLTTDEMWSVVHYVRSLSERSESQGLKPWRTASAAGHSPTPHEDQTGAFQASPGRDPQVGSGH